MDLRVDLSGAELAICCWVSGFCLSLLAGAP